MVTGDPTGPDEVDNPVMLGGCVTVNAEPLLATPLTVTTTGPVLAPVGTVVPIAPVPQLVGVAETPLNVRVLVLCALPKLLPLIVMAAPTTPEGGCKFAIVGVAVKPTALLGVPFTSTTIFPVVAAAGTGAIIDPGVQFVGVAAARLNITLPFPCVAPKLAPLIVTGVPVTLLVVLSPVIDGTTVVKGMSLLASPFCFTSTTPGIDPRGTVATICVGVQLLMLVALILPSSI